LPTVWCGHDPAQLDKYSKAFVKSGQATAAELQKLAGLLTQLKLQTPLVDEAIKMHEELGKSYGAATQKFGKANPES